MPQAIQSKRDTSTNWTSANTVLAPGQFGIESNTGKVKVGVDAGTPWLALGYVQGAPGLTRLPMREPYSVWAPVAGSTTQISVGTAAGGITVDSSIALSRTSAATNLLTVLARVGYQATSGASRMAGLCIPAGSNSLIAPTAGIKYGFKMRIAAAITDALSGQFGMGFVSPPIAAGSFTTTVQPSALLNCCFIGADVGDTNMSIMHNGASGACTKVGLGAGFPANSNAADLYELTVEFRSDGTARTLVWTATNLATNASTGGTIAEGSKMPVAGTPLYEFFARGSGASGQAIMDFYGKQIGPFA